MAQPEAAWKTLAHDGPLVVEGRPAAASHLREIRVRGRVPVEPEALFAVLWDVSTQHEWVPNVKTLRVVRRADDEIVLYERVKIPVVQDRDYVLRLTRRVEPTTRVHEVIAEGRSELGPPPAQGVVRMTKLWSRFTIAPAPGGGSDLTYVSFGDPAGSVPAWIIRAADVRGPRDFVKALVKRATR